MKRILSVIIAAFMVLGLSSCGYEDKQAQANAHAHELYTAFNAGIDECPEMQFGQSEYYGNFNSQNYNVSFDGVNSFDISQYLGNDFTGYFHIYIDLDSGYVYSALWSDQPILQYSINDSMSEADLKDYYKTMGTPVGFWTFQY